MLYIMMTGAFPFWRRGDERANSIVRLQQIFPRILAAEYVKPVASPVCLDLLQAMLTPNPAERITLPAIMQHPWFVKDLPPGLHEMNDHLVSAAFPPEVQPVQEIMHILQAATRQPDATQ
jgi:serine/threonine-protein kinase SRK2